jgi:hypothetical protein
MGLNRSLTIFDWRRSYPLSLQARREHLTLTITAHCHSWGWSLDSRSSSLHRRPTSPVELRLFFPRLCREEAASAPQCSSMVLALGSMRVCPIRMEDEVEEEEAEPTESIMRVWWTHIVFSMWVATLNFRSTHRRVPTALSSQPELGRWLASLSCQMLSHSSLLSVSFSCYCVLPRPTFSIARWQAFMSVIWIFVSRGVLKKEILMKFRV